MRREKVSASSLLEMIPDEELEFLAASTNVDYKVKKLNARLMFQLLVYSMVRCQSVSLRAMEEVFSSTHFAILNPQAVQTTTRFTSIRDRTHTINAQYFEKLFDYCSNHFSKYLEGNKTLALGASRKGSLLRFDSTMIALSAKLFCVQMQGMHVGANTGKAQIKITVGYNGLFPTKAKKLFELI